MKHKSNIALLLATVALGLFSFTTAIQSDSYHVLTEKSKVVWVGKKLGGEHTGIVKLKSGSITMDGDVITSGEMVVDMKSIKVTDSESQKLLNHIKGSDFFNVAKHPTSKLIITGSKLVGTDSLKVSGKMTILDKTNPITFYAVNTGKTENFRIYSADLSIDRTKYGITYKSSMLGDATIYDDFDLKIKLALKKD